MSVVVRDLSVPTACQFCPLVRFYRHVPNVWCNGTNKRLMTDYDGDPDVYIERPEWCPLVELPDKHGRLIEADSLKETLDYYIREAGWDAKTNRVLGWVKDEFIDSERTIVEAEV